MNFGPTAKSVLAAVAPLLGTAIGGPFGGLAGAMLSKALGTPVDQKAMEAAITSTDPDILVKLKQADNDFQVQMQSLGITADQLAFADTADAREREVQVKDWTPRILAYLVTLGFFGILLYVLKFGKPEAGNGGDVLLVLMGSLGTAWTGIIGYYFGSSAGSDQKSATLSKIVTKQP